MRHRIVAVVAASVAIIGNAGCATIDKTVKVGRAASGGIFNARDERAVPAAPNWPDKALLEKCMESGLSDADMAAWLEKAKEQDQTDDQRVTSHGGGSTDGIDGSATDQSDPKSCRRDLATGLMGRIDHNFYVFRDELLDPRHDAGRKARERIFDYLLLAIALGTAYISDSLQDETGSTAEATDERIDLTGMLTTLALTSTGIQGLRAILDTDEEEYDDLVAQMENNRSEIRECIVHGLEKDEAEYSLADLMGDLDRYYYAGTLRMANAPSAMYVGC
ncbi:MAG: hypothetical protein OXU77_14010 [Gammaproteobacteria bacterium]|nr:hypothetical protein [Gammaproteobacteria bacterium]